MRLSWKKLKRGFTLIEILVTVFIIGLLFGAAVPALFSAREDALQMQANANVRTLNEAATRARLNGYSGDGTVGSDKEAALLWYRTQRLVSPERDISLDRVDFVNGIWEVRTN